MAFLKSYSYAVNTFLQPAKTYVIHWPALDFNLAQPVNITNIGMMPFLALGHTFKKLFDPKSTP